MSSATDGCLAPRTEPRPAGLIAGVGALEVLTFATADYSAAGGLGAALPWMLVDFFLLRKIWRGSSGAWCVLVALDIAVIALFALTFFVRDTHVDGGPSVLVAVGLELALLAAPRMRRWVARD